MQENLDRVTTWKAPRRDYKAAAIMWRSVTCGMGILCLLLSFFIIQMIRSNEMLRLNNKELLRGLDNSKPTITIEPSRRIK
jgi:hypothetical protein